MIYTVSATPAADVSTVLHNLGIDTEPLDRPLDELNRLTGADTLVFTGPADGLYEHFLSRVVSKNLRVVVDRAELLSYHPFLIKADSGAENPQAYAKTLQEQGARNVLIPQGVGAVLITEDGQTFTQEGLRGEVVNPAGMGESMVAGFLAGYQSTGHFGEALRMGVAAGNATAFSHQLATLSAVDKILDQL